MRCVTTAAALQSPVLRPDPEHTTLRVRGACGGFSVAPAAFPQQRDTRAGARVRPHTDMFNLLTQRECGMPKR
jgi:hypothetical protein